MKSKKTLSLICMIGIPLIILGTISMIKIRRSGVTQKDELSLEPHVIESIQPALECEEPKVAKQEDIDNIVQLIEQEEADEISYIDELSSIYVGEKDKDFFREIINNSEKVTYYSLNNAPDLLCQYMIRIGNIEFGYKSAIIYQNDEYVYIFQLASEDQKKLEEWIEDLRKSI